MPRATRINAITDLPNGQLEVSYTAGSVPLPDGGTGAFAYPNKKAVEDAIMEFESRLSVEDLLLFHMAIKWLRADGTFKPRGQVVGTTMTLDMLAVKVLDVA